MEKITFEYVEMPDEEKDRIYIFIDHGFLEEMVLVDPDNQYYQLFDGDGNCIKHYKNHTIFQKNIKNDIRKLYNLK